eukprot:2829002-Amphidinium_carterae.1
MCLHATDKGLEQKTFSCTDTSQSIRRQLPPLHCSNRILQQVSHEYGSIALMQQYVLSSCPFLLWLPNQLEVLQLICSALTSPRHNSIGAVVHRSPPYFPGRHAHVVEAFTVL